MRDMTKSLAPRTKLWKVCEVLIANAPAKAIVNQVPIQAKFRTTKVDDIYRQYWLSLWRKSPTKENWSFYLKAS